MDIARKEGVRQLGRRTVAVLRGVSFLVGGAEARARRDLRGEGAMGHDEVSVCSRIVVVASHVQPVTDHHRRLIGTTVDESGAALPGVTVTINLAGSDRRGTDQRSPTTEASLPLSVSRRANTPSRPIFRVMSVRRRERSRSRSAAPCR